jgi:hypothetical protein
MKHRLRPKLTYSNVIATIALFVALGGVATAATSLPRNSVGSKQLRNGAVDTKKLRKNAVRKNKIAPKAVTLGKLGPQAVAPWNLGNGAVRTNKIANQAIRASNIHNNVVTTNKLNNNAVTQQKLAPDSVGAGNVQADAVGPANIRANSVGTATLQNGSVTADKLVDGLLDPPSVLPSGQTERGQFDLGGATTLARTGVSFPIPVGFRPEEHILEVGESSKDCPGRMLKPSQQIPEASPGHVCVYVALSEGESPALNFDVSGNTNLGFSVTASFSAADPSNRVLAFWAVTAP